MDHAGFLRTSEAFAAELRRYKVDNQLADYGWYPYETLTALPLIADLIGPFFEEVFAAIQSRPACDLGAGDGDLAALLSRLGAPAVDAVDHLETNFNQLRGVRTLAGVLRLPVKVHDLNLDAPFELPRDNYGLALFLGTLYHLRNPFYVLEQVARSCDWCILSTRIAQSTPEHRTRIADEPVAYLLDSREANNDPTNFWIFSPAGLRRIVERAGWIVMEERRVGSTADSDPVRADADERMFLLLKSRTRFPELQAWPLEGWHAVEDGRWRWTARSFSLAVALPHSEPSHEFALRFTVPAVLFSGGGELSLRCSIEGWQAGSITCDSEGSQEFRGRFPEGTPAGAALCLHFSVEGPYASPEGDSRELGVVVPLLEAVRTSTARLPFRIS